MRLNRTLIILSAGHGVNDFVAGYLLGNLLYLHLPVMQASLCFLVYNGLAFGGQYFAAILLKRFADVKSIYIACWLMNTSALLLFPFIPQFSFIAAGCASAFYHVIGGSMAAEKNRATTIGWFAAPGILGLALAGYLASQQIDIWNPLILLTVLFSFTAFIVEFKSSKPKMRTSPSIEFDKHDALMILILTIITMRSALWNIFQLIHQQNYTWLIAIGLSAFVGKILGGYISDRIGWRLYNLISLLAAAPLVSFFKNELLLFCIGVALLQSGIPANTAILLSYMKDEKQKAIALVFGSGVFVAGIVLFFPSICKNDFLNFIYLSIAIILSALIYIQGKSAFLSGLFYKLSLFISPVKERLLKLR